MIDDPTCPYRMGSIRSLEARVAEHHRQGGIGYIPSKAKKWNPSGAYQPLFELTLAAKEEVQR